MTRATGWLVSRSVTFQCRPARGGFTTTTFGSGSVERTSSARPAMKRIARPPQRPIRSIAGRAEDVLSTLPDPNVVVVNPPRAGLHWNVTLRLTSQPVARVIYRSCDPATLARDLHRLRVNYRVTAVRA